MLKKTRSNTARKLNLYLLIKQRRQSGRAYARRAGKFFGSSSLVAVTAVSLLVVSGMLFTAVGFAPVFRDLPNIETIPQLLDASNGELLQPSRLLDRSGLVTLFTYQDLEVKRSFLPVDPAVAGHVSPQLIRAVTALLEPDFWTSPGYRLDRLSSNDPFTIAEHLTDEILLWKEPPSPARNLRMRITAGQLVARYGRARVLEWYLNNAWFGRYAYGAESAAQLYLDVSARDLTLAQAALLTPLLLSPALNPLDAPETSREMQHTLLNDMLQQGVINKQEYDLAMAEELQIRAAAELKPKSNLAIAHMVEEELTILADSQRLQRGGIDVITTIDADLQQQLVCTSIAQLNRMQKSSGTGPVPAESDCPAALLMTTQSFSGKEYGGVAAAGLVADPATGELLAYLEPITASGTLMPDSGYQPGTLLSTIVAVGAFSRGYSPANLLWDIPTNAVFTQDIRGEEIEYHGAVNIRTALANNYLNPIASLLERIGAQNAWGFGSALGITSLLAAPADASPLLGGSETSLQQVAAVFGTLANAGVRSGNADINGELLPRIVSRVDSSGGGVIKEEFGSENSVILAEGLAYLVNHVLSDSSVRDIRNEASDLLQVGSAVAARTASADGNRQVWAVGYNSRLLVLNWMGNFDQSSIILDERMPAAVWNAVFRYASRGRQFGGWVKPLGISEILVCNPSGMLPTPDCPNTSIEVFLYGNEPSLPDSLFTSVKVNRETGLRATVFTPADLVEQQVFMNVPEEARAWALSAGISLAPPGYDVIQNSRLNPDVYISEPALFSAISGEVSILGTAAGDNFASYSVQVGEGINPETWQQIKDPVNFKIKDGILARWNTQGLNGLYAIRLSVVADNSLISTAFTQVTVDNTPPTAIITYPIAGQMVETPGGGVTLTASIQDEVSVAKVEWQIDGIPVFSQDSPPFFYRLITTYGRHEAQVIAWDSAGNMTLSEVISFQIQD